MNRFRRLISLTGEEQFNNLQNKKIAVCGVGGVGSYVAEALARSGIKNIMLIDFDTVAEHNINRQLMALSSTIGRKKVEVLKDRISDINPDASVTVIDEKLTSDNIDNILDEDIDFIADCIDDVPAKIGLILYGRNHNIPVISAMGTGNKFHPELLEIADISKTEVCPLCRSVRKRLREQGITSGVTVVYSKEIPVKPSDNCVGSTAFVPSSAGLLMASFIVNFLIELKVES